MQEDPSHATPTQSKIGTEQLRKKPRCIMEKNSAENCNVEESVEETHKPFVFHKWADEGLTPVDIFKVFWNDDIMEIMTTETNRYHHVKFGKQLNVTVEELFQVLGVLLLSGYNTVPNRRVFWSSSADSR